jgi:beta-N-acetylhexosaminidase
MVKLSKRNARTTSELVFIILVVLVLTLGTLNFVKAKGWLIPEQPPITITDGAIVLDELTLEQKIAQMVIVHGGTHNLDAWQNMQLGGIHLFAMEKEELFKEIINDFQEDMEIPFFVTADLEGCLNPFSNFYNSTPVTEIDTLGKAFQKGSDDGKFLNQMGFTINFAPVIDLDDQIWKCRSFPGDEKQIAELAEAYTLGLQSQGIIANGKHFPGNTLVAKDPHKHILVTSVNEKDIYPYTYLSEKDEIKSFMVSHQIVTGAINSEGYPSVVSRKAISSLKKDFSGLIISDDTMMGGLRMFYDDVDDLYIDVFKSGNDLILNFDEDPNEIYRMIQVVKVAVEEGIIPQEQIDDSVRKILNAKGFVVV